MRTIIYQCNQCGARVSVGNGGEPPGWRVEMSLHAEGTSDIFLGVESPPHRFLLNRLLDFCSNECLTEFFAKWPPP